MNDKLFNAILSMDSYNRGYNAGIKFGNGPGNESDDSIGTQIGEASIIRTRGELDAQNSNFYAIAYERNGETIISYRGTDDPLGTVTENFFGGDIWDGWTVFTGNDDAQQAELAVRFYQDVVDQVQPTFTDYTNNGVVLTGHSLGGVLAGLVEANDNYTSERKAA